MFPFQVFREFQPTLAGGFKNLGQVIRSLFAQGEAGVWYDPSDLSTLFQDANGTTPVTAVEQPVGLMLDKSKGLALGPELVTNGEFSDGDTGWVVGTGWSIDAGVATFTPGVSGNLDKNIGAVNGRFYAVSLTYTRSAGTLNLRVGSSGLNSVSFPSGSGATVTLVLPSIGNDNYIRVNGSSTFAGTVDNISVRELPGNHASQPTATSRPVLSARVNQYLATETLATQNVTTLAAQYRLSFEGTGTITLSGTATGVYSAGSHLITCTAGALTSTVSGSVTKADLRVANTGAGLPAYQRVNTATDYDTVGFPHYLRFDGVDDWMVTNTITPGIDKVQVFVGVRKLSDVIFRVIVELSTDSFVTDGSFLVSTTQYAGSPTYLFRSRGTALSDAFFNGAESPITNVLTGIGDISGDSLILRVNGTQVVSSTADQGTSNYGNYPLYIGRRGGTVAPFKGHLYSLIVRFGSNLPVATIERTEKYINNKTGAY